MDSNGWRSDLGIWRDTFGFLTRIVVEFSSSTTLSVESLTIYRTYSDSCFKNWSLVVQHEPGLLYEIMDCGLKFNHWTMVASGSGTERAHRYEWWHTLFNLYVNPTCGHWRCHLSYIPFDLNVTGRYVHCLESPCENPRVQNVFNHEEFHFLGIVMLQDLPRQIRFWQRIR